MILCVSKNFPRKRDPVGQVKYMIQKQNYQEN